jgi:hypothetical protein
MHCWCYYQPRSAVPVRQGIRVAGFGFLPTPVVAEKVGGRVKSDYLLSKSLTIKMMQQNKVHEIN